MLDIQKHPGSTHLACLALLAGRCAPTRRQQGVTFQVSVDEFYNPDYFG